MTTLEKYIFFVVVGFLCLCNVQAEIECNYTVTTQAWFDIVIKDYDGPGEDLHDRLVVGLFGKTAPITVLNFAKITNGYKHRSTTLHYKNTKIHRIVVDFLIQMGDVTRGDGTGGKSIYGDTFDDEEFILSHNSTGIVSMANHGKNTNGSQFFILLQQTKWLDGKHVVFGKLLKGYDFLRKIGAIDTDEINQPKKKVKILDCGAEDVPNPFCLSESQSVANADMDVEIIV
ncbi:peptidyl-prolyl cis-trans isomerase B [Octopus bimaculoides]|uniref:Peptidyl-prolyl cis-trans isomerase n=1 Tax=Octopus bimaculoides TaxID=37653 RepID=A0A0L8FHM4_OCTBM|nr:peptidyl-prolyl cis-trans isomerase B [Octopus bimaculoides]|eukprot:XP_014789906.1 PREDICTED: peptidyl-prolyl cis-trans isomerase B-like [Octopus bimaculoides]